MVYLTKCVYGSVEMSAIYFETGRKQMGRWMDGGSGKWTDVITQAQ